ncbi:hypothetical protein KDA_47360 [Dictyobacter alpinus]|uniref:Uncharacterized protein n=1 Tax=Dictyobacter alpinus TaxID=2014873 RepID=A0A402BD93_9CHLR|nr:hypothetical protein KDA_47360 [Dictyobacter alpinus]
MTKGFFPPVEQQELCDLTRLRTTFLQERARSFSRRSSVHHNDAMGSACHLLSCDSLPPNYLYNERISLYIRGVFTS